MFWRRFGCGGFGWGGGGIGTILMFVLMLVLVGLVIFGISKMVRRGDTHSASEDSLNVARERFAKGEITEEEFQHIKKSL